MSKKRTIYRDTVTGKFVKKTVWSRSKARGGERYKRQKIEIRKRRRIELPIPEPPEEEPDIDYVEPEEPDVAEYIVGFTYEKSGRSFDVLVTARTDDEAFTVARQFLRDDEQGKRVVTAGFQGWKRTIARGDKTDEAPGEAEYRSDSES